MYVQKLTEILGEIVTTCVTTSYMNILPTHLTRHALHVAKREADTAGLPAAEQPQVLRFPLLLQTPLHVRNGSDQVTSCLPGTGRRTGAKGGMCTRVANGRAAAAETASLLVSAHT